MPVNFQQIQQQVRDYVARAPRRRQELQQRRDLALRQFALYRERLEELGRLAEQAAARNEALRSALPAAGPLDARHPAPPPPAEPYVLLAADGSQVHPDRHEQVEFAVINAGVFRILPGQGQPPRELRGSRLLVDEELHPAEGPVTEEGVSLLRDLSERQALADQVEREELPVVALTDGPLELFREPSQRADYQRHFREYLEALHRLAARRTALCGYVDRPRSDLVVRLLELTLLDPAAPDPGRAGRPLQQVGDADLFGPLLAPGERSAVFGIQSLSARHFRAELALHFFYLNVGPQENGQLARVEIPRWVADDPALLGMLQAVLVEQVKPAGGRPYPYALHRAHEVALVGFEEKNQLRDLIVHEMLRQGIPVRSISSKQGMKNISEKRARYSK